jgi:hypothetical protein
MRLLRTHGLNHGFDKLTWIDLICCRFNIFLKGLLEIYFKIKLYFYQLYRLSLDPLSQLT